MCVCVDICLCVLICLSVCVCGDLSVFVEICVCVCQWRLVIKILVGALAMALCSARALKHIYL